MLPSVYINIVHESENTKNYSPISDVLLLRLKCDQALMQMFICLETNCNDYF